MKQADSNSVLGEEAQPDLSNAWIPGMAVAGPAGLLSVALSNCGWAFLL